jgi:Uma2 family endonuclease
MAFVLTLGKPVTDAELLAMSEANPGVQFERDARGALLVTPTGSEAGRRELVLATQLAIWARQDGTGVVFGASTGFRLPDGSVRAPDAAWVSRERWAALTEDERAGFAPLCPEVVFEIASPSDTVRELQAKMAMYLANGARLGVLVMPPRRAVEIYRPGQAPRVLADPVQVELSPELPGFTLVLSDLFAA